MATTITTTQLDFDNIKSQLKTYLASKGEFTDYDFETSGISNLLDVLAYNTHFNGLIANFALNESFLNTAQLRSSVVSHSETLGYNPRSITSAIAYVVISTTITAAGRPSTITLPVGTKFTTSVNEVTYTFQTLEAYVATDNGSGLYTFLTSTGSSSIPIYEGTTKTKTFYAGELDERQIFIVPDQTIDTSTATVNVYTSSSASSYTSYYPLSRAVIINAESAFYQLRETPNSYYELIFGDGISTGRAPVAGNKISLSYLSSHGTAANTASGFIASGQITVNSVNYNLSTTTAAAAAGGASKESIEAIRQNAPISFATQQRLVTAQDYKALILANYSSVADCIAWGGEDNEPAVYGKVFVSLKFADDVTTAGKQLIKDNIVNNLTNELSVLTIDTEFADPTVTYLECQTFLTFNPDLSNLTANATETRVQQTINNYFSTNLQKFKAVFRRSNILTHVDELSGAILNSRMDVKMQQRFTPTLGASGAYTVSFPVELAAPDDVNYTIVSNNFILNGEVCRLRNTLTKTTLEIVNASNVRVVTNAGYYDAVTGKVVVSGFAPSSISGGLSYIRLSALPANQSTIRPLRNYILDIDTTLSFASAIIDYEETKVAL